MMRFLVVTLLTLWLGLAAGCSTRPVDMAVYEGAPPRQKYTLAEVTERLDNLEKGMAKLQVLLELGSPAKRQDEVWVYMPSDPGLIVPSRALAVRFEHDRYVGHSMQPIIVGERIIIGE